MEYAREKDRFATKTCNNYCIDHVQVDRDKSGSICTVDDAAIGGKQGWCGVSSTIGFDAVILDQVQVIIRPKRELCLEARFFLRNRKILFYFHLDTGMYTTSLVWSIRASTKYLNLQDEWPIQILYHVKDTHIWIDYFNIYFVFLLGKKK